MNLRRMMVSIVFLGKVNLESTIAVVQHGHDEGVSSTSSTEHGRLIGEPDIAVEYAFPIHSRFNTSDELFSYDDAKSCCVASLGVPAFTCKKS